MLTTVCETSFISIELQEAKKGICFFTLDKAQEPLVVEGYIVRFTVYGDMLGTITVKSRLKHVMTVMIWEAYSWESVPQKPISICLTLDAKPNSNNKLFTNLS